MKRLIGASAIVAIYCAALCSTPSRAAAVTTAEEACGVAKARTADVWQFPVSEIAFCDQIDEADSPIGYYVLGIHGKRDDCGADVCGSTLLGWFAIEKSTGRVFEFDLEKWKPGPLIHR